MKVLIADDDPVQRRMLAALLTREGHEYVEVEDGTQALATLVEGGFDSAVIDWMMPGMTGPAVIRAIRSLELPHYLYIIMLSALDEEAAQNEGMAAGADDFLTKPLKPIELSLRLRVAGRITGLQRALAARNRELQGLYDDLTRARKQLEYDLGAAAAVQREMLPPADPAFAAFDCAWSLRTCDQLGGDMIDLRQLPDGSVIFAITDVSGHGIKAALLSVQLSRHFDLLASRQGELLGHPARVLADFNASYQMDPQTLQYFTMLYGVLDGDGRSCRYATAGHPPPVHLDHLGLARHLELGGTPIGILPPERATFPERTVVLEPGERLLGYSDGITETFDRHGNQFGRQRLLDTLAGHSGPPGELVRRIEQAIDDWSGSRSVSDDCSLLVIGPRPRP